MKSPELTTQHRLCTEKKPLNPFALKLEVETQADRGDGPGTKVIE